MKKFKVILVAMVCTLSILGAFESKSSAHLFETQGAPDGSCNTAQNYDQLSCDSGFSGAQCTIGFTKMAWVVNTNCLVALKRP